MTNRITGATQIFRGVYGELFNRLQNTEFIVYEPRDVPVHNWFERLENVRFVKTDLMSEIRLKKFILVATYWPNGTINSGFDLFESFNLPITASKSGDNLLTIHDIRGFAEDISPVYRTFYSHIITDSIRKATKIITVSQTMRKNILNFFPDSSVYVVYIGVDASLFRRITAADVVAVKHRFGIPDQYILTVGHIEKRKNHTKLVDALFLLRKMKIDVNLVIVGKDRGEAENIINQAKELGIVDKLFILNGVSDADVRAIYRGASLFVFPSKYEGFGIPIIEAMAAEIPIIVSNIPVFREICEDSVAYFNYNDCDDIVNSIRRVIFSEAEAKRIVQYGRRRVVDFSFSNAAESLLSVYKDVF